MIVDRLDCDSMDEFAGVASGEDDPGFDVVFGLFVVEVGRHV
jgi:hypothetical protein